MVYGGAGAGKKVMTSSSSPGISLKQEGLTYIAGSELPCLVVNVVRGGPGLGTIQPSQSDYFQAVKGGGHGDYKLIVLAPNSVQEMNDFVDLGFELAFKYRNPVMILSDGVIGQMMEKVELSDYKPRMTDEFIAKEYGSWAATGKPKSRERNIVTSLELDPARQEKFNEKLQKKYAEIREKEARFENFKTEDAEYLIVAYGSSSRISKKSVELLRAKGIKVGLLRPITLFPFPEKELLRLSKQIKGILTVEMSAGQMIEDVKLAVNCSVPVKHYGRFGGMIPSPDDIVTALEQQIIGGK
jgi:2-oxoglutarate ferredoxin oxidoreductase subunit alpha